MLNFIPPNTIDFEQLWSLISSRNRWFIKLRFIIVAGFALFVIFTKQFFGIDFTSEQLWAYAIIALSLFVLNIGFSYMDNSGFVQNSEYGFNQLHFAFNQIIIDLLAIALISYYSGGIESPFYMFFVFHMIIGSLILPGYIVYVICGIIVAYLGTFSFLEYYGVVAHHSFGDLLQAPLYDNYRYILIIISSFGIMMIVSVYLANTVARSHYQRSQQLRLALNRLRDAEKIKMKYTMGIVHEIKSPLVGAQSNLDLILNGYTGEINTETSEKIKRARIRTDEAVAIINDILKISKLKLLDTLTKEDVDLVELFNDTISKKESQIQSMNANVKIIDDRKDKKSIKLDRPLFELVVSNLVGNAVKYNTHGGEVRIYLRNIDNDEVEIVVADDGMGIPDEDKGKMFHDFYRANNVKQKGIEGTGLGLSVVKEIIEQHDGEITFNSPSRITKEGRKGTEFIITLPNI